MSELDKVWSSGTIKALARWLKTIELWGKPTSVAHPKDMERWFAFIIEHHRNGDPEQANLLGERLTNEGWPAELSNSFTQKYQEGIKLLAQYDPEN
jgi:hypothetical protein